MTASTTPCWKRHLEPYTGLIARRLLALMLAMSAALAHADGVGIAYAEIVPRGDSYVINADIRLTLNARITEAIAHGIPVHFVAEANITAPRWYWFDKSAARQSLIYQLSFHPLTRSYRLSVGGLHQRFDTLDAAIAAMRSIRNWPVAPIDRLTTGTSYNVALRFYLDTDQLPRPFLVSDVGRGDWSLESDWARWTFLAGPLPSP